MSGKNQRVLAVGTHPDDVELTCAGTLSRLRDLGYEVHIAVMCCGDKGTKTMTQQQAAATRLRETEEAAKVIGATAHWVGLFDLEVTRDLTTRRLVCDLLRKVDPLIVFSPPEADYMLDHEVSGTLVREACFNAMVPNFFAGPHPPLDHIPYLYYVGPSEGGDVLGRPAPVSTLIDITATIDRRVEMLACHASQREWLHDAHGWQEYLDTTRREAARAAEGYEAAFAEPFCQHIRQPYPKDDLLKQLLGEPNRRGQ
jgi:LmbE family N-acetylglucosaminyl deacetylase